MDSVVFRNSNLLHGFNHGKADKSRIAAAPHLAERRYLGLLKKSMEKVEDTLASVRKLLDRADSAVAAGDSTRPSASDSLRRRYDELQVAYRSIEHEHGLIIDKCLGGEEEGKRESEEMQAKSLAVVAGSFTPALYVMKRG